jgi:hypothetical protein
LAEIAAPLNRFSSARLMQDIDYPIPNLIIKRKLFEEIDKVRFMMDHTSSISEEAHTQTSIGGKIRSFE